MGNVIEIKNLSVYYDSICALEDVNLAVRDREFLGIIGPNGGGKTTLLKVILGLIKPSSGSVRISGKHREKGKTPIGYVPQFMRFDRLFPVNVEEVVLMGRLPAHKGVFRRYDSEDRKVVQALMEKLEVLDLKDRQIGGLSGGQMQRVLIARALAMEPEILLLDEPTASLDAHYKTEIYSVLKELNKDITVIIVTHDTGVISSYVNSIACLNRKLYYHGEGELDNSVIQQAYGCPVDLIGHGIPHRVFNEHEHKEVDHDKGDF